MSYILEALRKSDEERQKNGGRSRRPAISFAGRNSPPRRRKLAFGLILMSFILVVSIILGFGWWWSRQDSVRAPQSDGPVPAAAPAPEIIASPGPDETPATAPPPAPPETFTTPAVSGPEQSPSPVFSLSELSAEFRQGLPELRFSGHVYSPEPELRMIMINDSVYREGDPLEDSLSLAEITERGVILSRGNTLFRIDLL